ncbi:4'-phosphopantetheinyl transferase superfamily protein [Bosea sp. 124]|nr:4'-phosphopantetheinyl transferase superfamily protein [Bosea sp. 124]
MIWLDSPEVTATALPAAWLIVTTARPANLAERSLLRRETARRVIARQLGLPADEVCIDHDGKGRPLLARPAGRGLHLSLATRAGVVAVALAQRFVGIDIERIDPAATPPFAALHPAEGAMLRALPEATRPLAFARLWSAKEAYVKALGTGFVRAPESFSVTLLAPDRFEIDDPLRSSRTAGTGRAIENGGQGILAAAIVTLD